MQDSTDLQLHHGAISVSDLERSIAFYGRVFGMEEDTRVISDDGQMEIVHLRRGTDFLELFCHRSRQPLPDHASDVGSDLPVIGVKHIAFSTDNPEQSHQRLEQLGVEGLTPIREAKYYKFFFFKDPDGILFEVVHRKTGHQ